MADNTVFTYSLPDDTYIIGMVRHPLTQAYVVFLATDSDEQNAAIKLSLAALERYTASIPERPKALPVFSRTTSKRWRESRYRAFD